MNEENSMSHDDKVLRSLNTMLVKQIFLEAQIDALKTIFVAMMSRFPGTDLKAQNDAYKNLLKMILDEKMKALKEANEAFADDITNQMQDLMKDLPGIILPSVVKHP